jgi:arabinose-5-phosphate isomerase
LPDSLFATRINGDVFVMNQSSENWLYCGSCGTKDRLNTFFTKNISKPEATIGLSPRCPICKSCDVLTIPPRPDTGSPETKINHQQEPQSKKIENTSDQDTIQDAYHFVKQTCKTLESLRFNNSICDAISAVSSSVSTKSTVITTGMGKAGHIAQKTSSLLSSLGISSFYIHPGESSHGDIGVLRPGDILFVFSTSGKTREVIETIDLSKELQVGKIISITSHLDSPVRQKSDIVIDMGHVEEAGYLHMAPTTSMIVMLTIADIIATSASKNINFNINDYSLRHHGGYLGEKSRKAMENNCEN